MTIDVDVKHLVIDGDQAAVISDYFVKTPAGTTAIFEVPEFLTIHNGKLTGISIFFDSAAFTALMKGEKSIGLLPSPYPKVTFSADLTA